MANKQNFDSKITSSRNFETKLNNVKSFTSIITGSRFFTSIIDQFTQSDTLVAKFVSSININLTQISSRVNLGAVRLLSNTSMTIDRLLVGIRDVPLVHIIIHESIVAVAQMRKQINSTSLQIDTHITANAKLRYNSGNLVLAMGHIAMNAIDSIATYLKISEAPINVNLSVNLTPSLTLYQYKLLSYYDPDLLSDWDSALLSDMDGSIV